jgi:hypothetical protein
MAIRLAAATLSVLVASAAAFGQPAYAAGSSADLLAAVRNVSGESDKFRSMMSNLNAAQFHLVDVSSVMTAADETAYKSAVRKNASDIADLRDTLNHTTITGSDGVLVTLRKVLLQKNISIDQITGVYVGSDGQITLFYQ